MAWRSRENHFQYFDSGRQPSYQKAMLLESCTSPVNNKEARNHGSTSGKPGSTSAAEASPSAGKPKSRERFLLAQPLSDASPRRASEALGCPVSVHQVVGRRRGALFRCSTPLVARLWRLISPGENTGMGMPLLETTTHGRCCPATSPSSHHPFE